MSNNNYILPYLEKQEDIGNTVEVLNRSFKDLENFLSTEKQKAEEISDFVQNINTVYDKIDAACLFLEKNKNHLNFLYRNVVANKTKWLKPIILFYKEKFYDNSSLFSDEYINDLLCKWMQSNYPVKFNNSIKPNYVDGQTAVISYIRSLDEKHLYTYNNENSIYCQTEQLVLEVNCFTTVTGRTCAGGNCGCVDCAMTAYCKERKVIDCFFGDREIGRASCRERV